MVWNCNLRNWCQPLHWGVQWELAEMRVFGSVGSQCSGSCCPEHRRHRVSASSSPPFSLGKSLCTDLWGERRLGPSLEPRARAEPLNLPSWKGPTRITELSSCLCWRNPPAHIGDPVLISKGCTSLLLINDTSSALRDLQIELGGFSFVGHSVLQTWLNLHWPKLILTADWSTAGILKSQTHSNIISSACKECINNFCGFF